MKKLATISVFFALLTNSLTGFSAETDSPENTRFTNCSRALTGLRFFSSENYSPDVSYEGWNHEAKALMIFYASHIVSRLANSLEKKEKLADAIRNPEKTSQDVPNMVLYELRSLERDKKDQFISLLLGKPSSESLVAFLKPLYEGVVWEREKIKKFYSSFYIFFQLGLSVDDVKASDGLIDIPKLLKTGKLVKKDKVGTSNSMIAPVSIKKADLLDIIYVILKDEITGAKKMYLSVLDSDPITLDKDWGPRHHSHLSQGRDVEYAGNLYLTSMGRIRIVDLFSGHFMANRQREIDDYISAITTDPKQREDLANFTAQQDRSRLIKILKDEFGLAVASNAKILVREDEWLSGDGIMEKSIK